MAAEYAQGVFQALPIDTRPGENHVFSPPAGFNGDAGLYRREMLRRWKDSVAAKQQIQIAVTAFEKNSDKDVKSLFVGPYADKAMEIVIKLRQN